MKKLFATSCLLIIATVTDATHLKSQVQAQLKENEVSDVVLSDGVNAELTEAELAAFRFFEVKIPKVCTDDCCSCDTRKKDL